MKKTILLTAAIACLTLSSISLTVDATTAMPTTNNTVENRTSRTLPGNTTTPGTNQYNNNLRTEPNTDNRNRNVDTNTTNRNRNLDTNTTNRNRTVDTNTTNRNRNLDTNTTNINRNQDTNTTNMNRNLDTNTTNINATGRGTLRTIMVNPAVRLSMSGATGAIKINDSNSYKQIDISCDIDNTKMTNAQLVIDIPKNLILGSYSNGEDIASIQNTTNIIQPDGSRTLTFNFLPNTSGTQKLDFLVMLPNGAFGATGDYTITARLDQAGSTTQQLTDSLRLIPSYDDDLK